MLYEKKTEKCLSDELFKNPTKEYRGTPFWSWNCKLDIEELKWQIEQLKLMGFGGAHMHSRSGMATEYLSDEFFKLIRECTEKLKEEDMLAYLYDEDRWPSGSAGGIVTKNHKYRQRMLTFSTTPLKATAKNFEDYKENGGTYPEAVFDVVLNSSGKLESYRKIGENDKAEGVKWYAYLDTTKDSPRFNGQAYIDTMNPEAAEEFIRVTYEPYKKALGEHFGTTAKTMFTDEPEHFILKMLENAESKSEASAAWTPLLKEKYFEKYNDDITDYLPELFFEVKEGISTARYRYHELVAEMFSDGFMKVCGDWCEKNGISFTGHLMNEAPLSSQARALGEAMRHYKNFQIPGIDMLCNRLETDTAKQMQSAVHQYGREGGMSELYGVTNWDYDFRGHKYQGDWQAALGVTLRVPHLSWVTMEGRAKRDYPASINYQSPWYKEYSYIEDHYSRLNTALTRGKPVVKVGVIHPVESMWLHLGSMLESGAAVRNIETEFEDVTSWLLFGNIDFDYISEALIPELERVENNKYYMGEMCYDVILVPPVETIRKTTVTALEKFQKAGGKVMFLGDCPEYVDAVKSQDAKNIYELSEKIQCRKLSIWNALSEFRDIEIKNKSGEYTEQFIYTLRQDNDCKWLFIANVYYDKEKYNPNPCEAIITIKGEYTPYVYDTMTGEIKKAEFELKNSCTVIKKTFYDNDSLLLKLTEKTDDSYFINKESFTEANELYITENVSYSLSEPNVYILDMAQYSLDGGEFLPCEEVLRIDEALRKKLSYVSRSGQAEQPWVIPPQKPAHKLTLKFKINSEIECKDIFLALEQAEASEIVLNGEKVNCEIMGYYTDKSIKKVKLPILKEGENILTVTQPFGVFEGPEAMYLLGAFGVKVEGCEKIITALPEKIGFSDITAQGFPFYGGNITYESEITIPENKKIAIEIPHYKGTLTRVRIDGADRGVIAFAPYKLEISDLSAGKHKFEFILFGNRVNTFGPIHRTSNFIWIGPEAWSTKGNEWSYSYQLKPTGILSELRITIKE